MPMKKGRGLHDGQGTAPVEAASEPHQGEAGSIRGTAWFDVAVLREGKLLAQNEVFRCQHRGWA